jgi:hypothetical protein
VSPSAGIPADAVAFYAELEANNTKDWWTANKERYEQSVREPFAALTERAGRRVRRGADLPALPRRAVLRRQDALQDRAGGHRVGTGGRRLLRAVGSDGLVTGGGYMHGMPDQVARYRAALDADGAR